jgi:hypothetical protein
LLALSSVVANLTPDPPISKQLKKKNPGTENVKRLVTRLELSGQLQAGVIDDRRDGRTDGRCTIRGGLPSAGSLVPIGSDKCRRTARTTLTYGAGQGAALGVLVSQRRNDKLSLTDGHRNLRPYVVAE